MRTTTTYSNKIWVDGTLIDFVPYKQYRTPKGGYYQGMGSREYWRRREKELLSESFESAEEIIAYETAIYERALRNLVKEYKALIRPYIIEGELDIGLLNQARISSQKFYAKEVKIVQKIDAFTADLPTKQSTRLQSHLEKVYTDNGKEIARRINGNTDIYLFDRNVVATAVRIPWTSDGREFSDRIWQHTDELRGGLRDTLSNAVLTGESPNTTIRKFKEQFGNSTYNTARLVRTETAAIQTRSTIDTYKELGVEYLEVIGSSSDGKCSPCIGKKIRVDEAQVGVNTPPFHPNCRCGIVPVVE